MVDLQLAEGKNPILGQDFLTWLWYKSETGSDFRDDEGGAFAVTVEQRVAVQGGGSGEGVETAVVSGPTGEFREARLGLRVGKKVSRALLKIESDGLEWIVQLKADDLSLNGLKTPKVETRLEEGDDPDAVFLEKMYLLERAAGYLDGLYKTFLELRLGPTWREEARSLRLWLEGR